MADPLTGPTWKDRLVKFFNVKAGPFKPGRIALRPLRRHVRSTPPFNIPAISTENMRRKRKTRRKISAPCGYGISRIARTDDSRPRKGARKLPGVKAKSSTISAIETKIARTGFSSRKRPIPTGVSAYWEVYDRRRRLKRLRDFTASEGANLSTARSDRTGAPSACQSGRAAFLRGGPSRFGGHSVWLEAPSTVRISHLLAAKFPEVASLGKARYQFLSTATVPEDVLGRRFQRQGKGRVSDRSRGS